MKNLVRKCYARNMLGVVQELVGEKSWPHAQCFIPGGGSQVLKVDVFQLYKLKTMLDIRSKVH